MRQNFLTIRTRAPLEYYVSSQYPRLYNMIFNKPDLELIEKLFRHWITTKNGIIKSIFVSKYLKIKTMFIQN